MSANARRLCKWCNLCVLSPHLCHIHFFRFSSLPCLHQATLHTCKIWVLGSLFHSEPLLYFSLYFVWKHIQWHPFIFSIIIFPAYINWRLLEASSVSERAVDSFHLLVFCHHSLSADTVFYVSLGKFNLDKGYWYTIPATWGIVLGLLLVLCVF